MREWGLVGFGKNHVKNRMTPPSAYQFFHMVPPYSSHFLDEPPPLKKEIEPSLKILLF